MTLDLLDTPLRVTWDLGCSETELKDERALQTGRRLGRAGIFYLTLEGRPLAHRFFAEILQTLLDEGVQVSLVYASSPQERAALTPGLPLQRLWLDVSAHIRCDGLDRAAVAEQVNFLRDTGYNPSLLMVPLGSNIALLPELFALSRELNVGTFKLPNVPINGSFFDTLAPQVLVPGDLERLSRIIGDDPAALTRHIKLEIHDRFVWELFADGTASELSEYGGCQAANSLAHVDSRGTVLPCSSWPEPIGDLLNEELEEIWASERRLRVRREISAHPDGCKGCSDYALCLGACRGLGRTLREAQGERDPGCSGPR